MSEQIKSDAEQRSSSTTIQVPRPSSPRKFFARLYGHLEEPKSSESPRDFASESSSDVEVEESGVAEELVARSPPLWPPPPLLPLCPRPLMLPYQQLATSPYYNYLARRRRKESRPRRQRTTFSAHQTLRLELEYARGEYVAKAKRCELASALSLSENQVKIWFQNRRAKDKRIEKAQIDQQYRYRQLAVSGLLPSMLGASYCTTPPCYIPLQPPPPLDK